MKKFLKNLFTCFVILVIFGSVLFFLGWTQFRVPSNSFGIIVSKTGGISKDIVVPGVFSWHWEFLIPSNAELKIFKLKNYQLKKNISYSVPSGDVYASLISAGSDFNANYDFTADIFVSRESLFELFSSGKITNDEDLENYIDNDFSEICKKIVTSIQAKVEAGEIILPELFSTQELLELAGRKDNSTVEYSLIKLSNVKIPDYRLFKIIRENYLEKQKISFDSKNESEKSLENKSKEQ